MIILFEILCYFCSFIRAGGPWHITDMRRGESIFEIDLNAHEEVERGFELEGSNLSGVSARCSWNEEDPTKMRFHHTKITLDVENSMPRITEEESQQIKTTLQKGLQSASSEQDRTNGSNFKMDDLKDGSGVLESTELLHVKKMEGVHLVFNLEAGSLLPLAIRCVKIKGFCFKIQLKPASCIKKKLLGYLCHNVKILKI